MAGQMTMMGNYVTVRRSAMDAEPGLQAYDGLIGRVLRESGGLLVVRFENSRRFGHMDVSFRRDQVDIFNSTPGLTG
jgi:hypothetical protein